MDVAGLIQMFVNAGAQGLKQIALAGVDVHTLGALLTLGNLVPASNALRLNLNECRTKQRKSSSWIYKAIEIGGSTNFLVDELLKTRAGESVLALFSAIMPVLSENSYTETVLKLFSHSRIDADSTPGIGQLQRLRASILAFTNTVDIKNKILQYHLWFRTYSTSYQEPHHAIPNTQTIAELVQAFIQIAASDSGYRMEYKGLQGAAWAVAYARDVLGLGTCLLVPSPNGDIPIPINAKFESAQLVAYIAATEGNIEICKLGKVEELITKTSATMAEIEWNIDCSTVNYFAAHHPEIRGLSLHEKISEFVAAKTLDTITAMSRELTYSVNVKRMQLKVPDEMLTYQDLVLPSVRKRGLAILRLLGYCLPTQDEFIFNIDTGNVIGLGEVHKWGEEKEQVHTYWQASLAHKGEGLWSDELDLRFRRYVRFWTTKSKLPTLDPAPILVTSKNAVLFAAFMAFTDWETSIQHISSKFFDLIVLRNGISAVNINAINNIQIIQQFCTAIPLPEPLFWSYGQEINGVVLLRNVILAQSISAIDGIVLSFRHGRIMFHGERCIEIAASQDLKHNTYKGFRTSHPKFHSYPPKSPIKLIHTSRLANNIVYVGVQIMHENSRLDGANAEECLLDMRPEIVAEVLSNLLVTQPCKHDYHKPLSTHLKEPWKWIEGLAFSAEEESLEAGDENGQSGGRRDSLGAISLPERVPRLYYQAVEKNDVCQWAACHLESPDRKLLFIWQRKACLDCTMNSVNELRQAQKIDHDVCIIAGGTD